jgi:5-(aminomethyl)-3-furanmethanol phosphate kinase
VSIETVVKVGGSLLGEPDAFAWALRELSAAPLDGRVLVVPGGGPFADTVRAVDARMGLSDSAAHWAAIQGMNQYALVLADHLPCAMVVDTLVNRPSNRLSVLAPYAWLKCHDALPHSWDVTSDSIAASIAQTAGARRLILMKLSPTLAPYFETVVPPGSTLETEIVLPGTAIEW